MENRKWKIESDERLSRSPFSIFNSQLSILRYRRGFTLAELLVSMGLIILFTAFLLPSFSGFGRRNELLQGSQLIQSRIFEAKAYALAPRAAGGVSITDYRFVAPVTSAISGCGASASTYAIVEITESSSLAVLCAELPAGLRFISPERVVTFSVVRQGAITEPVPPATTTFQIEHTRLNSPGNTRTIEVRRATGQVTITSP